MLGDNAIVEGRQNDLLSLGIVWRVKTIEWEAIECRLFEDGFHVAEVLEAHKSMGSSIARHAYATEGQVDVDHLKDCLIDDEASRTCELLDFHLGGTASWSHEVHHKWFLLLVIDVIDCLIDILIRNHRENWPKDFLLKHLGFLSHILD